MCNKSRSRLQCKGDVLVSIVVPVFNIDKYLPKCVESILNQTYKNIEAILVNDGSADNSGNICDEYASSNKKIKVIHQVNSGSAVARNAGLAIANGKYVYFLDGDDWIKENAVELLVECAESDDVDVVLFDSYYAVDEGGSLLHEDDWFIRKNVYSKMHAKEMFCEMLANKEYYHATWLTFIRRDVLLSKNIRFPEGMMHYDDALFNFWLFMCSGVVVHLSKKMYYRRLRQGSVTRSALTLRNVKCYSYLVREVSNYLKQESELYLRKTINAFANYFYGLAIDALETLDDQNKDVIAMYSELIKLGNSIDINKFGSLTLQNFDDAEYVIWYGAGRRCLYMADLYPEAKPNEIWDINAESIGSIYDTKVLLPDFNRLSLNINLLFVVCVDSPQVWKCINSNCNEFGFVNLCSWEDIAIFCKYRRLQEKIKVNMGEV